MPKKTPTFRKRRNSKGEQTRLEIIEASGLLFAERGYYGVSIRDISDSLKLMPSLVIHHFGTKENLYQKTVEHYILGGTSLHRTIVPLLQDRFASREAMAAALASFVHSVFETWHGSRRVRCLNSLLLQLISGQSPVPPTLIEGWVRIFEDAIKQFLRNVRDDWTPVEMRIRLEIIWANLFYPGLVRGHLLFVQGWKEYSAEFLHAWEQNVVRDLTVSLGLPLQEASPLGVSSGRLGGVVTKAG